MSLDESILVKRPLECKSPIEHLPGGPFGPGFPGEPSLPGWPGSPGRPAKEIGYFSYLVFAHAWWALLSWLAWVAGNGRCADRWSSRLALGSIAARIAGWACISAALRSA